MDPLISAIGFSSKAIWVLLTVANDWLIYESSKSKLDCLMWKGFLLVERGIICNSFKIFSKNRKQTNWTIVFCQHFSFFVMNKSYICLFPYFLKMTFFNRLKRFIGRRSDWLHIYYFCWYIITTMSLIKNCLNCFVGVITMMYVYVVTIRTRKNITNLLANYSKILKIL